MKHVLERLAAAGLLFVCATSAMASDTNATPGLKEPEPVTGPTLKHNGVVANVPLDKRYDQMDEEQRGRIRAEFEAMAPSDEPPFPADGMAAIMMALRKGAAAYHVSGELDLAVNVGSDGAARSVSVFASPNDAQFKQFVASLLLLTRYKAAVCAGQPCSMAWPLQVTFSRR
jgi:hypothetical protein